jgi:hypothetical protein
MTTHEPLEHPELEELAAYVDGRLSGADRDRVTDHLDRCPDCFELVAETVRFQREDETEQRGGGTVVRSNRFGRLGGRKLASIAAAAAALVALAIVIPRLAPGPEELPGPRLASADLLEAFSEGTARAAVDAIPRDTPALGFAGDPGRGPAAVRLGARLVDLRTAARAGSGLRAREMVYSIEDLIASAAGEERDRALDPALDSFLEEAGSALDGEDFGRLEAATSRLEAGLEARLETGLDRDALAFGKWAEAGRLAAAAGDGSFFRSAAYREARNNLRTREPSSEAEELLRTVDRWTRSPEGGSAPPGALDTEAFETLERAFGRLLEVGYGS